MDVSKRELYRIIREEAERFRYPADEMVAITGAIFSLADSLGVSTTPDQRDTIVKELETQMSVAGYHFFQEQLELGEEVRLFINRLNTPRLYTLLNQMQQEDSSAFGEVEDYFAEGGLTVSLKSDSDSRPAAPAAPTDDEDLTDTEVDLPPVDAPEDEDLTDTEVDLPPVDAPEDEPDEEEEPEEETFEDIKVGDVLRVDDDVKEKEIKPDFGTLEPGDYDVEKVWADERDLVHRDTGKKVTLFVSDIHDNSDVITINPILPKIKNPWAFKWFWEEEEEEQPGWLKKAAKGIKGMLGGSNTSIKVIGGLTGIAGIVGLMKYLAKDEEKVNEAAALKKGAELEELGEVEHDHDYAFITQTLKFVLSLTLDKEQMKTVDTVEEVLRLALVFVHSDDPERQKEIDEGIYNALDMVPGIEWLDKLPGGRERMVEIIRERWAEMSTKEKINLIVALLPQNVVERLEALIPGPDMQEMDMRWPDVQDELGDWLTTGELDLQPEHWSNFAGLLFSAADMFGLLDGDQASTALDILYYTDEALHDAKDDSNMERMTKIMDALLEHKKQLNRMKVLAGVK